MHACTALHVSVVMNWDGVQLPTMPIWTWQVWTMDGWMNSSHSVISNFWWREIFIHLKELKMRENGGLIVFMSHFCQLNIDVVDFLHNLNHISQHEVHLDSVYENISCKPWVTYSNMIPEHPLHGHRWSTHSALGTVNNIVQKKKKPLLWTFSHHSALTRRRNMPTMAGKSPNFTHIFHNIHNIQC